VRFIAFALTALHSGVRIRVTTAFSGIYASAQRCRTKAARDFAERINTTIACAIESAYRMAASLILLRSGGGFAPAVASVRCRIIPTQFPVYSAIDPNFGHLRGAVARAHPLRKPISIRLIQWLSPSPPRLAFKV
jgi:hypothetical protein